MKLLSAAIAGLAFAASAHAQGSQFALRFHGTGAAQQDRVRIPIDDDANGADASEPCDVGAGSFTLEFWLRGTLADNASANSGGDVESASFNWIEGNTVVDRDIYGGSERDWGISIAGGFVRFGTGRGDSGSNADNTIEGDVGVLDGAWHHVACVRNANNGRKRIYVDGALDFESSLGVSTADLSYPNAGVPGQATPWGPYIVLGAEKHDAGANYPSFAGFFDELRVWSVARTQAEIAASYDRVVDVAASGLVGYYRFEEGSGVVVADSSNAASADGQLIAGVAGNGEWRSYAAHPSNTAPVTVGSLPAGFTRTTLVSGLTESNALAIAPDGRVLVAERGGAIRVYANGQLLAQPLIQIPCNTDNGERGLVGIVLDPQFASNGYLYAFFTTPEPRDAVARYTVIGNTANFASQYFLWQASDTASDFHHGGGLAFGLDGNLYIAVGEQRISTNSQDPANDFGKLVRIRPDGSVPPDNPFVGVAGYSPNIYALGLRNPFRIAADPLTGAIWIGDVGGNGASSYEELDRVTSGANYGWPNQEGPACFVSSCAAYSFPQFSYAHADAAYSPGNPQGCVIAGAFYRGSAFPAAYQGNLFVADYANRWIRRVVMDAQGNPQSAPVFMATPEAGTIVDLDVGPDGALYYVTIGIAWSGASDTGGLHRIAYTGSGNEPPIALAAANPTQGTPPLAVQFSSAGTSDPDGGPSPLSYSWTFGDGGTSTAANPQHTYAAYGPYTAQLSVGDGAAVVNATPLSLAVGNRPVAAIDSPAANASYRAGDVIAFSGSATDVEDGVLGASAFAWQVFLVHESHAHPFVGPITGVTQASFNVPTTGHAPADTYYEIRVTVTDSHGLTDTEIVALQPELVGVVVDTLPSGIPVFVDGEARVTPAAFESLIGFRHELEAQASFAGGAFTFDFMDWAHGRPRQHLWRVPAAGGSVRALYAPRPEATLTLDVQANARNAEHWAPTGQTPGNFYDAQHVCVGRDTTPLQMAFEFALPLPQGARIVSARLDFTASYDNAGSPSASVRAYDVGNAPPFVFGSATSLTSHAPLTSASLAWTLPSAISGQTYSSPDLTALVQEVVDRGDWQAGNFLGVVLDGAPTSNPAAWRCVRNFAFGVPPRLIVTFSESDVFPR